MNDFLTPEELAKELRVTDVTLSTWRKCRIGPPFIRMGRIVRYRRSAVDAWSEQQEVSCGIIQARRDLVDEVHVPGTNVSSLHRMPEQRKG
jgi:excisionase family DNA binding protein